MFCRPASSRTPTNGVIFHTSARISGTHAADASANQVGAATPARAASVSASPDGLSNMKRQTKATTTVGMAQGRSAAVRASPRALVMPFSARASARPPASSSVTDTAANSSVCPTAPRKRASAKASR